MNSRLNRTHAGPPKAPALVLLLAMLALLTGCGAQAPTPIVLVVTNTVTPSAETVPTLSPEPGPPRRVLQFEVYEHPSGAFRLELPQGAAVETAEDGASLVLDDSLVLIRFTAPDQPLAGDELQAVIPTLVEAFLVDEGRITSFSDLEVGSNQAGDAVSGRMAVVSERFGKGEAEMLLWQVEHALYMMVLVTPD